MDDVHVCMYLWCMCAGPLPSFRNRKTGRITLMWWELSKNKPTTEKVFDACMYVRMYVWLRRNRFMFYKYIYFNTQHRLRCLYRTKAHSALTLARTLTLRALALFLRSLVPRRATSSCRSYLQVKK